ncbi:hypothetical protein [Nocardioides sp. Leaf285]|uniref:hypothetical protein n=1 Tax=Nocardioides sp. Leaf285 TaxID=1736322 RepID=UPI000702976A|nr:hypothetical protein [Nocardioides sp. Leaf285]KQP62839.1 hypothetical protein ASF47_17660 [Nocardioides sp. Leaf285]
MPHLLPASLDATTVALAVTVLWLLTGLLVTALRDAPLVLTAVRSTTKALIRCTIWPASLAAAADAALRSRRRATHTASDLGRRQVVEAAAAVLAPYGADAPLLPPLAACLANATLGDQPGVPAAIRARRGLLAAYMQARRETQDKVYDILIEAARHFSEQSPDLVPTATTLRRALASSPPERIEVVRHLDEARPLRRPARLRAQTS